MRTVLVTGASSGIGRATVVRLARHPDLLVYASARREESLAALRGERLRTLPLDVTDEASRAAAVSAVESEHGAVDVLVNNAGYGAYGTVEETDLDEVRRQFETNVFGLARLCQLVLPGMRAKGAGRIVNIGSMGGRITFPVGAYYHASKYAVEAFTDVLRFEVAPFGISVVLLEPGLIRTGFEDTAGATLAGSADPAGPYAALNASAVRNMASSYRNRLISASPDAVARVVEGAVLTPRPRHRYVVTPAARALIQLRRLGGSRVWDAYLARSWNR